MTKKTLLTIGVVLALVAWDYIIYREMGLAAAIFCPLLVLTVLALQIGVSGLFSMVKKTSPYTLVFVAVMIGLVALFGYAFTIKGGSSPGHNGDGLWDNARR